MEISLCKLWRVGRLRHVMKLQKLFKGTDKNKTMETSIKSYAAKEHHQPVKRYCRTLDLRDDPKLIAEYRRRHSQAEIWPEVIAI